MLWDSLATTALSDMLRSEMVQHWIEEATQALTEHRASAAKFAAVGNHAAALSEIEQANHYRRRIAIWQAELLKAQGEGDE